MTGWLFLDFLKLFAVDELRFGLVGVMSAAEIWRLDELFRMLPETCCLKSLLTSSLGCEMNLSFLPPLVASLLRGRWIVYGFGVGFVESLRAWLTRG